MQTKNRFMEISTRLTSSRNRFSNPRRISDAKFLAGCGGAQHPPVRSPVDVQREMQNLQATGQFVAEELFEESISTELLPGLWQVLDEAAWFALSRIYSQSVPGIDPPSGEPTEWFKKYGVDIEGALRNRVTPALKQEVQSIYGERYRRGKTSGSQSLSRMRSQRIWSTQKDETEDNYVLDVLQFFFDERLTVAQLNDHLKRLAAFALNEAINASKALDFVPRPPALPPTINWLIGQAVQIAVRRMLHDRSIYEVVRITVKARLRSEYELAKLDVDGALSYRSRPMAVNNLILHTSDQGLQFMKQFPGYNANENISLIENAINNAVKVPLSQSQFDALVSFCTSITVDRFMGSTLFGYLNPPNTDFTKVAEEIRKWKLVEGNDDPELIQRRSAEAELFLSGSYSSARSLFQSYSAFARAKNLPRVSRQQNPAAVIAAVGVGFQVLKGFIDNRGDVTYDLAKMDGQKCPFDDEAKYKNKAIYQEKVFTVRKATDGIGGTNTMSADFEVKYKYNGYAVGHVSMQYLRSEDAIGWGLDVKADIMADPNSYNRDDGETMAAIEVTFNYRFSTSVPLRDDDVWIGTYKIFGDGRMVPTERWTSAP